MRSPILLHHEPRVPRLRGMSEAHDEACTDDVARRGLGAPPAREGAATADDPDLPQREKFLAWLNEHWLPQNRRCPICASDDWRITEVVELPRFREGLRNVFSAASVVIPVVGVTCQVCGFVHWFNAMISGVVGSDMEPFAGGVPT